MKRILPFLALAAVLGACSGQGDATTGAFADDFGGSNQKGGHSVSADVLPGATIGSIEYQKKYSCPVDEPGASVEISCGVYSNGDQVSSVVEVTGSKDGESLAVSASFIVDTYASSMKGQVTMDAIGSEEISAYKSEFMDEMCREYKNQAGFTVACGESAVTMEGSIPKRTKSQLVEGWKEMCSEWCSYF